MPNHETDQALLDALEGIRQELQNLTKTVAALSKNARAPQPERAAAPSEFSERPRFSGRPSAGRPDKKPSGRPGAKPAFKRSSTEDGEATGYGAEMAQRFPPKKRGSARPKKKSPAAKKGGGYPKRSR